MKQSFVGEVLTQGRQLANQDCHLELSEGPKPGDAFGPGSLWVPPAGGKQQKVTVQMQQVEPSMAAFLSS